MVQIDVDTFITYVGTFHRKSAIFIVGVDSDAPFIVFTKAAADIKVFGPGAASGKTLCIAGDRVSCSTFSCTV